MIACLDRKTWACIFFKRTILHQLQTQYQGLTTRGIFSHYTIQKCFTSPFCSSYLYALFWNYLEVSQPTLSRNVTAYTSHSFSSYFSPGRFGWSIQPHRLARSQTQALPSARLDHRKPILPIPNLPPPFFGSSSSCQQFTFKPSSRFSLSLLAGRPPFLICPRDRGCPWWKTSCSLTNRAPSLWRTASLIKNVWNLNDLFYDLIQQFELSADAHI